MILCINQELVPGKDTTFRKVVLQADTASDITTMPQDGTNVKGLDDACEIYASSILVCLETKAKYVLGSDNTWYDMTE